MDWGGVIQAITMVGLGVVGVVGGWAALEFRRLHSRIDKYTLEMDEHIKESTEIRTTITRIDTTQELHIKNGRKHKEE